MLNINISVSMLLLMHLCTPSAPCYKSCTPSVPYYKNLGGKKHIKEVGKRNKFSEIIFFMIEYIRKRNMIMVL